MAAQVDHSARWAQIHTVRWWGLIVISVQYSLNPKQVRMGTRSEYNSIPKKIIVHAKAPISLGCDEFAMGLRIDLPNRRELSRNVRMVSQSPRMHRELVANGSPKF